MKEFKLPNTKDEKSVLKTIRIKLSILEKVESLSKANNISINRLLNECIEFALENIEESSKSKK